jgi:ribosome-associated protein
VLLSTDRPRAEEQTVTDPVETGPPEHALLRINEQLAIPLAELRFSATRSGGPGGQHVNTSATRVELEFDVGTSPSLTDEQRARVLERLRNRIDGAGVLRLGSSKGRSQHQNREDVTARFASLLDGALQEQKPRRRTKVPRAEKEARLRSKKKRSQIKKARGPVPPDE